VPGIDFNNVRAAITMEDVQSLLGFEPLSQSGVQWHGSCPLHDAGTGCLHRLFSVNVAIGRCTCH